LAGFIWQATAAAAELDSSNCELIRLDAAGQILRHLEKSI
jgi:hypothetical protein